MPIAEWELWACANEVIRQHGHDAGIHAGQRADELLLKGDIEGARTWMAIIRRIGQLQSANGRIQ
jgi:hypothetical protein